MTVRRMIRRTATVTRTTRSATETDEYNVPVEVTETAELLCHIEPVMTVAERDEVERGGDIQSEMWLGYFLPDADLEGWDRLTVDGVDYEFVGPPGLFVHPRTNKAHHYEARLRRTR